MTQPGPFETPPVAPQSVAGQSRQTVVAMVSVAAATVIVLAAVAGVLVWHAQAASVSGATLEPINLATADSFMPAHGPDASVATPPARTGGAVTGNTPGLFGGTQDNSSCDQDQMSQFLQSHPDKGAAWAAAEGIQSSDIPTYVHQLTPVLLRADTYITNHGYRDGELTSYPAVLQSGTAVLVDGYGTPRVKCYCGNPVSAPPRHQPAHFEGRPWTRFAPVTVIVIQPAPVVVENLTIINIQNNIVYNVVLPPWQYGPPPGWDPDSSTDPSSSDPSSSGPSSSDPSSSDPSSSDPSSSDPSSSDTGSPDLHRQPNVIAPGSECGSLDGAPIDPGATAPATCASTTTPTTTTPTTTTPTTTTPTTTTPTTTTTTTST